MTIEEEALKEALREGLVRAWKEESAGHVRKVGRYYPSGIGACLRKQFYDFVSPKPPTPEELAIFATGKGIHEAAVEALSKSSLVRIEEVELPVSLSLSTGVSLSGRVDVLLAELAGKKVVVELKSTSALPSEPHEGHVLQLQTYLHALNLDLGLVLYWDKRTGQLASFSVTRDPAWMSKIGERVFLLDEHLKSRSPPFREAFVLGKYRECDMCAYLDECAPFTLKGADFGAGLSLVGISPSDRQDGGLELSPDLGTLKSAVDTRKAAGDFVILLSDLGVERETQLVSTLKEAKVNYDAVLSRPVSFRYPHAWKLELARRLSAKYNVNYYSDTVDRYFEEVIRFAKRVMKQGEDRSGLA